jgi:hypothetical protein
MPIQTPNTNEAQADFISRCAGDKTMNAGYPKTEQRVAICYQQWRDRHKAAAKSAIDELRETVATATRSIGR